MLVSKNLVKVVSIAVASMSLMGVGASVSQAASFPAPKLGVAETMPTDPAIKKGDKIFGDPIKFDVGVVGWFSNGQVSFEVPLY